MKKTYTQPTIEVLKLEQEDIITTSGIQNSILGGARPGDNKVEW